jgi:vacuolar protein sorting-associated protein 11
LIEEDMKKIKEDQTDTMRMKKEIELLKSSAKIFQLTNCSHCGNVLDLPSYHFMCGHSYHQKCLNETDDSSKCLKCSKKNKEILQIKKKITESSNQHESFFKQIKSTKSSDGFSVVSDYFGRGIFDQINKRLVDNDDNDDDNDDESVD